MSCSLISQFPNLKNKKYPCLLTASNDVPLFFTTNKPPVYNGRSILEEYETWYLIWRYIPGPYQVFLKIAIHSVSKESFLRYRGLCLLYPLTHFSYLGFQTNNWSTHFKKSYGFAIK